MIGVIFVLVSVLASASATQAESGCLTARELSGALAKLGAGEWRSLTRDAIRNIWPVELVEWGSCSAIQPELLFLRSEERIVRGKCECCSLFEFWPGGGVLGETGLHTATITATTPSRRDGMTLGRSLATEVGVDLKAWHDQVGTVAPSGGVSLQFTLTEEAKNRASNISVSVQPDGTNWRMTLGWTRTQMRRSK